MFEEYLYGIDKLVRDTPRNHPCYHELLIYQVRLHENIGEFRRLGDTEEVRHNRFAIIDSLNRLCLANFRYSFYDICYKKVPVQHDEGRSQTCSNDAGNFLVQAEPFPYTIEHADESREPRALPARGAWRALLQQRVRSREEWLAGVMRAWSDLDGAAPQLARSGADARTAVENIAFALLATSLPPKILPELVLYLVGYSLWSYEEAQSYASLYEPEDRRFILARLNTQNTDLPGLPEVARQNERVLSKIAGKPTPQRAVHLKRWLRRAERSSVQSLASVDLDLCHELIEQLRDPIDPDEQMQPAPFEVLLESLRSYNPPQTARLESRLLDMLGEMNVAWMQVQELPQQWLSPILREITRVIRSRAVVPTISTPRTDLLEALIELAPAVACHFPEAVDEIGMTVKAIVEALP